METSGPRLGELGGDKGRQKEPNEGFYGQRFSDLFSDVSQIVPCTLAVFFKKIELTMSLFHTHFDFQFIWGFYSLLSGF